METIENAPEQEFVASFALQRQRLLHQAGTLLTDGAAPTDPTVTQLSQMLMTSLELLKVAEEELRDERRTNALRTTAQERRTAHFSALFDLAPVPLVLTTADTTIRESNQAASALLGWDSHAMSGRRLLDMVSAPQRAAFREQLAHAVEIGSVAAWSFPIDRHRSMPTVVSAAVNLISDAAVGTRALYWSLRSA